MTARNVLTSALSGPGCIYLTELRLKLLTAQRSGSGAATTLTHRWTCSTNWQTERERF